MGEEVRPSWLSSLVGQANKVILWTGGYGEESIEHTFSDDESDGGSTLDFDDDESDSEEEPQTQTGRLGDEDTTLRADGHASLEPTGEEGGVIAAVSKGCGDEERSARNSHDMLTHQVGSQRFSEGKGEKKAEAASLSTGDRQENSPDMASTSNSTSHEATTQSADSSSSGKDLATPARDRRENASGSLAGRSVKAEVRPKGVQGGESGWEGALLRHKESISSAVRTSDSPLFETPSRNRARDDHVVAAIDVSGVSRGEAALDPTLVTPFRSRDREDSERGPPLIGVFPAGGSTSRRINRTRNGEKTVRDPARAPVVDKVPPARSNETPSPSSIPVQLDEKPRPVSMGRKRFSFLSDTSWLKTRDALHDAATTLQAPNTTAPVATKPRARTSFTLPPTRVAEWGSGPLLESDTTAPVTTNPRARTSFTLPPTRVAEWGSGPLLESGPRVSPPPPRVREWRKSSSEAETSAMKTAEMDKQLRQDMASAAYPEPESDPEVGTLSDNSSREGIHELRKGIHARAPRGVSIDECPKDGNARVGGLKGVIQDDIAEGEDEEEEQTESDLLEPDGDTLQVEREETATIGAKRASVENGKGPHENNPIEDWSLTPPEAFAPSKRESKRGKTQSELHRLAIMRHSSRLDDVILERQRKMEAGSAGNESEKEWKKREGDDRLNVPWPDRALRPYDCPIVDTNLPALQAGKLCQHGFGKGTLILCSPFRRCLQTAGVVARTLGVDGVTVRLELGERMDKVRKEMTEEMENRALRRDDSCALGKELQRQPSFCYLSEASMLEALGEGVRLHGVAGEQPPTEESGIEAKERFTDTIANIREDELRRGKVIAVTHGDALNSAGESLASQIIFEADYCAWAVFDLDDHSGHIADSYGIQMISV